MIVCADDLTLLDLSQDSRPGTSSCDHIADLLRFIPLVIEIKNNDVSFAANNARMLPKILIYLLPSFGLYLSPALCTLGVVPLFGCLVICRVVSLLAVSAHIVAAVRTRAIYGELTK